ncbi:uncharacterized protein HD556DRAFT_435883 [Suillus plorans]|uniref:Uncharacterized protein n=1 Tax=Suillus plorans TaxID=116603 RepID=A0A9P7AR50_9AGAM|nr:uncharacterized protein HD556DRAFT_435883 [Suillus plorans]KAG1794456.1 hypothetical protein HD556DRAFT_435883 [Suillus plorans]
MLMADSISNESRSISRGRDSFQSSGRGGAGNIRRSSVSSDPRPVDDLNDSDSTRGREQAVHPDRMVSVGRGGVGNMRTPSQDVGKDHPQTVTILNEHAAVQAGYEQQVKKHHAESNPIYSSGRGGIGNISGSRSRSQSRGPIVHSTGRGGVGNIQYGAAATVDNMDEEERKKHLHAQAIHSTGRGGTANLTSVHSPDVERVVHHHAEFESSGRGGAGNIRSRSVSRDPSGRTPSRDPKGKHGITALWNKVSHPSNPGSGDPGSRAE